MDTYGKGQEIGAMVVCYCKKREINVDDFIKEIRKNPLRFIDGISDGIGNNRDNGRSVNNGILEHMKISG